MLIENLLLSIGACIVLIISAELLVKSLTKVAFYFGLSEFVVGFMIVALATSIPEFFVGITSALEGNPKLSVCNVIGANIIDLTLVIGIVTILRRGIKVETKAVRTDVLYMFIIAALPLILMMDQRICRFDGFILLIAFFLYILRLFKQEKRFRETVDHISRREFVKNTIFTCVSIISLLLSADFLVKYASSLAIDLSVPPILIGLLLISLGTTLPELTFEAKAILMRHRYMALGDLIGSVVTNTTLVLGVVALISEHPIEPNFLLFLTSSFFMIVVAFLFTTFVECEKHILWQEGVALILLYVLFVIVLFNVRMMEIQYGIH